MAMARQWRGNGEEMARKWRGNGEEMARKWRGNGKEIARKWRGNPLKSFRSHLNPLKSLKIPKNLGKIPVLTCPNLS